MTVLALQIRQAAQQRALHRQDELRWWERLACRVVRAGPTPRHVAFIMDGNRRYARNRGHDVSYGHRMGYRKLEEVRATARCRRRR